MAQLFDSVGNELNCIGHTVSNSITKKKMFCTLCVPMLCSALETHRYMRTSLAIEVSISPQGMFTYQQQLSCNVGSTSWRHTVGARGCGKQYIHMEGKSGTY